MKLIFAVLLTVCLTGCLDHNKHVQAYQTKATADCLAKHPRTVVIATHDYESEQTTYSDICMTEKDAVGQLVHLSRTEPDKSHWAVSCGDVCRPLPYPSGR